MSQRVRHPESNVRAIGVDLFAGAGGMSLGAALAGIDVRLAVEIDPCAAETYRRNHPETEVLVQDIRKLASIRIRQGPGTRVLFGGPPCQGFSTSNQRTRTSDNPNNWLFREFLRVVGLWRPDWVVFENVRGITDTEDGVFLLSVIKGLASLRYTVSSWVLGATDYGVPQRRSRLFVVGSRHGVQLAPPRPTVTRSQHVTVRHALSDLPDLANGAERNWMPYRCKARSSYAKSMRGALTTCSNHLVTRNGPVVTRRYAYIPPGGNWREVPPRHMNHYTNPRRYHSGIYRRLELDEPSVVIGNYRKNMLIHPTQDRGLSVREAARLQSFPDWYEFTGSIGFQQQQVGNALPPLMARAVFGEILDVTLREGV